MPHGKVITIFEVAACRKPPTIDTAIPNKIDAKRFTIFVFTYSPAKISVSKSPFLTTLPLAILKYSTPKASGPTTCAI